MRSADGRIGTAGSTAARLVAAGQPAVDAAKKNPSTPQNRQLISTAESYVPMHKAYDRASWPDSLPAVVIVSEKTPFDGSPEDARRPRMLGAGGRCRDVRPAGTGPSSPRRAVPTTSRRTALPRR
ncbi:hypothetical protein [Streptomyces sp. NBC_00388]|uniref:hypothetical protein n=1 Tax=Streptomyces sp. NBC_00388 TaxID=2975735 RepID=UPI002E1ADB17